MYNTVISSIEESIRSGIQNILSDAISKAEGICVKTVKRWEIQKITHGRAIIIHWSTYRTICSRSGKFLSKVQLVSMSMTGTKHCTSLDQSSSLISNAKL
jgi:hypothetical protein